MNLLRRFLLFLAVVALVGLGTKAFAVRFTDTAGTVYQTAFDSLADDGIISGYPDGSGRPYSALNRAEALKVVLSVRSEDRSLVEQAKTSMQRLPLFQDIDQLSWYAPYIEAAYRRGIVTGYPDGTFRPDRPVAVEEAIALLLRVYGERGSSSAAVLSSYIENHDGQWYTPYFNAAIQRNLLMHAGTLRPGTAISRGQFFDIAYRLHEVMSRRQVSFNGPEPQFSAPVQSVSLVQRTPGSSVISVGQTASALTADIAPYASEKYFAITMPSIGITDLSVIHPSDPFSKEGVLQPLQNGVGHLFSFPGRGGKIMIYGHSSAYPWDTSEYTKIFRKINGLNIGDRIYVTYDGKLYVYEVTLEETVPASDTSRYNDDGRGESLILYTCWPPDSISQRYLVHAIPVKAVALR